MVQIIPKCNKCRCDIEPGVEKSLQLIDRKNLVAEFRTDGDITLSPKVLWEYTLCPKCFKEFNDSTSYPYSTNTSQSNVAQKSCWKCGKALTLENISNVVYTSNPPKYTCKVCDPY